MLEVEIKILHIDINETIRHIERLWWMKIYEWDLISEFYVNPENKKIRLRKKNKVNTITYKEKASSPELLICDEYETTFDDFLIMQDILIWLGFKLYRASKKYRISYILDDVVFDIDKYDGIDRWVMEVESNNKISIERAIMLLWYSMEDTCNLSEKQIKESYWL